MKKTLLTFTVVLFIISNSLKAQVPGFEGSRFSLYYSGSFFVHLSNPGYISDFAIANIPGNTPSNVGFNYRNDISADYVVSRSTAIGVGVKLLNTAAKDISISQSDGGTYYYPFANMQTKFFSIYIKKFLFENKGYIAPVGSYYKLELALGFTNVLGDTATGGDVSYINNLTGSNTPPGGRIHGTLPSITSLMLFYTVGQQRIIAKHIYIDYGVDFGIPITLIGKAVASGADEDDALNDAKYKFDIESRLFDHVFFNVHIGTGILLF